MQCITAVKLNIKQALHFLSWILALLVFYHLNFAVYQLHFLYTANDYSQTTDKLHFSYFISKKKYVHLLKIFEFRIYTHYEQRFTKIPFLKKHLLKTSRACLRISRAY